MERLVRVLQRRAFPCIVLGILAIPLLAHVFLPQAAQSDNRSLAPSPGVPGSRIAFMNWPHTADAYLKDHFGLRAQLIGAYNAFNWRVLGISTDPRVIVGRNGRLFFSENETRNFVLLSDCGAWWPEQARSRFAAEATAAIHRLQSDFPHLKVLVVPTSDLVYPTELPEGFQRACAGKTPLVKDWLARLPADVRDVIAYPIDAATHLPPYASLIPGHNFHWAGRGVSLFMEAYAEDQFHLNRQTAPAWKLVVEPADLERFLPGAGLSNEVQVPVWPPSVRFCGEDDCLRAQPLGGLTLPRETLRLVRDCAGPRLLLFSDSFGWGAASGLIEYFCEVFMINMNDFQLLSETDRRALWSRLKENWGDGYVLAVANVGNITLFARFAKSIP
jgi:hypothetical protein